MPDQNRMGNLPQRSQPVYEQERPREADVEKLRFLRWLAEQGRLEHDVFAPPSGEYA